MFQTNKSPSPSPSKSTSSYPTKSTKQTVKTQVKVQKQNVNANANNKINVEVGSEKAINFEMQSAFGKPIKSIKMTKVNGYSGEIPLILHLLVQKLISLDKFGTFKLFNPEQMEKDNDKPEMQIAHNIFVFFSSLPEPLLHTVDGNILNQAINKDVMKNVIAQMDEPYASTLVYLWDILAKVAMNPGAKMSQASLGKVFGPMCCLLTQKDVKGNMVSMNALGASRMMVFFRRGIEWRMEVNGFNFDSSSDDDSD